MATHKIKDAQGNTHYLDDDEYARYKKAQTSDIWVLGTIIWFLLRLGVGFVGSLVLVMGKLKIETPWLCLTLILIGTILVFVVLGKIGKAIFG